jgi:hypothetical protein
MKGPDVGDSFKMSFFGGLEGLMRSIKKTKTKLHGLSPRANYTDRATAVVGEVIVNFLPIEGATWSA